MRRLPRLAVLVLTALVVATIGFASPAGATGAPPVVRAAGSFTVASIAVVGAEPVGDHCRLTAELGLRVEGDLSGEAEGRARILVFAPCDAPPGTAGDVGIATLRFDGTVGGDAVTGHLLYVFRTGGDQAVSGIMRLRGSGARGVLHVDATAGVGGTYEGRVLVR